MKKTPLFPIKLQNLSVSGTCVTFALAQALAILALVISNVWLLSLLTILGITGMLVTTANFRPLARYAVIQTIIISLLYLVRFGSDSIPTGLLISWKLCLAYIPFIVLSALVSTASIMSAFSRFLPPVTAFTLGCCLRFFPFFLAEAKEIYHVQRMRGACLAPRDAWKPLFWRDVMSCLFIPILSQCFLYANNLALAAKARGVLQQTNSAGEETHG